MALSTELRAIAKNYVPVVPPPEWKQVGNTPDGRPIYERVRRTAENVPLTNPQTGEIVYEMNAVTGARLYQRRQLIEGTVTELVVPFNQGNGNLSWEIYRFPTEEEVLAAKKATEGKRLMDELAGLLVEEGLSPAELLAVLRANVASAGRLESDNENLTARLESEVSSAGDRDPEDTVDAVGLELEAPVMTRPGVWRIPPTNEEFKGTKSEALARQRQIVAEMANKPVLSF